MLFFRRLLIVVFFIIQTQLECLCDDPRLEAKLHKNISDSRFPLTSVAKKTYGALSMIDADDTSTRTECLRFIAKSSEHERLLFASDNAVLGKVNIATTDVMTSSIHGEGLFVKGNACRVGMGIFFLRIT